MTWSKCPVNVAYALHGRHGSVRTKPDPDNLKNFIAFAQDRVRHYAARALIHLLQTDISLEEYMSKFPKSKRQLYMNGYQQAIDKQSVVNVMTLQVKKELVVLDEE